MSWTTVDEMAAINFISSGKRRANGSKPNKQERLKRLENWRATAETRRWDKNINLTKLLEHFDKIYAKTLADKD